MLSIQLVLTFLTFPSLPDLSPATDCGHLLLPATLWFAISKVQASPPPQPLLKTWWIYFVSLWGAWRFGDSLVAAPHCLTSVWAWAVLNVLSFTKSVKITFLVTKITYLVTLSSLIHKHLVGNDPKVSAARPCGWYEEVKDSTPTTKNSLIVVGEITHRYKNTAKVRTQVC